MTAGLVRVLRKFGSHPHSLTETSSDISDISSGVQLALDCLCQLMQYDNRHPMGIWKPAYDAGIVSVLSDLLKVGTEQTIDKLLTLCTCLVLVTPPGEEGRWAETLSLAVAGLLTAKPPVAPARAADTLITMCISLRQHPVDPHKWGLGDSLRELATHSDPETATAAKELLSITTSAFDVSCSLPCYPLFLRIVPLRSCQQVWSFCCDHQRAVLQCDIRLGVYNNA